MAKQHTVEMSAFDNCIQDPQSMLAKALEDKNIREFKIAMEMEADPTRIDEITRISLFEKALQTNGCHEFVDECIRRGCKYDYVNRLINKRPINFATDSQDPKILAILLKFKDIQVDVQYSNLTPLNSLCKNLISDKFDNIFECIKLLIEFGANPNIPDHQEKTPILHIINNRKITNEQKNILLKYFFSNSEVDVDSFRDGEARLKISSQFPNIILPENISYTFNYDNLLSLLRNGNEEKFLLKFSDYQLNISEQDNQANISQEQNVSLLIESIKKGLHNAVDEILKTDVNINLTQNGCSPIEIACTFGNWKALQKLIDNDDLELPKDRNLLISVIRKLDEESYNNFCDYYSCFYILLDSNKIDVNDTDKSGSSALHYAVKYKNEKAIKELLKRGAYIGTKSAFNDLPISEINSEILEEFFDNCITTNGQKLGDDNFEIIIDYTNLIPNHGNQKYSNNVREEMLPIEHIAESKELRHLLKHPLITSFLFLKWHRLSVIFYINFILYAIFCCSLVTYILLHFNHRNETDYAALHVFQIISIIGVIYMIIRELIQFLISPTIFLQAKVNYLEITLIILTIITLTEPNYEKETQRVIAVITILLASVELCLLVGSLPVLSISTHMLMLQAVSTSFIKSFGLYSIFVITFSLCFYILLGDIKLENEDGEFNNFVDPLKAIIKTIVMLTGEFDAGDMNLNSLISYLVFLLFVFFMSIVLFNLLNGLAVSDTHAIKTQAELNGCICRTKLLSSYEGVMTGKNNLTGFFINLQPFKTICKNLTNIFPNFIPSKCILIAPNDHNKIFVSGFVSNEKNDILFKKRNGATLLSYQDELDEEKQLLKGPLKSVSCWAGNCSQMDHRTVKTALRILEQKQVSMKEKQKVLETENRLKKIENRMDEIYVLLKELTK